MALEPPKIRREEFLARVQNEGLELQVESAASDPAIAVIDVRELAALYYRIEDRVDGGSPRNVRSPRQFFSPELAYRQEEHLVQAGLGALSATLAIFARADRRGTLAVAASRAGMSEVVRLLPSDFGPGAVADARETLADIESRRAELEARLADLEDR